MLERKVLYLACGHHIHEILFEEAFNITIGPPSRPEILLFKRFKAFWPNILIADYRPGVEVSGIATALCEISVEVTVFAMNQHELVHQYSDYRELLKLAIVFLAVSPRHPLSSIHGKINI